MFLNRIRLPFYLKQPQFPNERTVHRRADGVTKTLSVSVRKTYQGETDHLDPDVHQWLTIALNHDTVNIEDKRLVSGVSLDGEYQIEYVDFIDYPLGKGSFQVQVTPFNQFNDNCQTCEEATQLDLVDDTFVYPLEEGEEATISAFDNDTICCYPITAEITTFNTQYVESASIDADGIITIQLKAETPTDININLVTYRVTCPNGGYDEANVIGDVNGSIETCQPPTNLEYFHIPQSEISTESEEISFTESVSTPDQYEWILYNCGDLGTPIDSGTVTESPIIILPPMEPGGCFVISIRSVCDTEYYSDYVNLEFTTPGVSTLCGRFQVTANDGTFDRNAYEYTYIDCNGAEQNRGIVNLRTQTVCMLVTNANNPIYFAADPQITYEYIEPCS